MEESRDSRDDPSPSMESSFQKNDRRPNKSFRTPPEIKYNRASHPFPSYLPKKPEYETIPPPDYLYNQSKEYTFTRNEDYPRQGYDRHSPSDRSPIRHKENTTGTTSPRERDTRMYAPPFTGRQFRSNSISGVSLLSLGQDAEREKVLGFHSHGQTGHNNSPRIDITQKDAYKNTHSSTLPMNNLRFFRKDEVNNESESEDDSRANKGRKKIKMEFIKDKGRRGVTFSKRKKGIMKKAYELNVLTKCEILLVVASETGHVYTFATPKLQPIIKQHENLIQQYLNTPYLNEVNRIYDTTERYGADTPGYYKNTDSYGYDRILRGHEYPPNYYHSGYDTDSSPGHNNGSRL